MARIRIEDLPTEDRILTPEELAELEGAGRPSFRPTIETLEGREMYAANLGGALAPDVLSLADAAKGNALVQQTPLANPIQVEGLGNTAAPPAHGTSHAAALSPALDAALRGFAGSAVQTDSHFEAMGGGLAGQVGQPREWDAQGRHNKETIMANGDKVLVQSWDGGGKTFHFVTVTNRQGANLVTGEDYGSGFAVTLSVSQTKLKFKSFGGEWKDGTWVSETGQTLLSRETKTGAVTVHGELRQDGKWEEHTIGSKEFQTRTDVFDKADGNLLQRDTTYEDRAVKGELKNARWIETTSDLKGVQKQAEVFDRVGGTRLARVAITFNNDGTRVETTTNSKEFQTRTEVYGKDKTLQTRETMMNDGAKVHGEWKESKWVEITTGSKANQKQTQVYDRAVDGTLVSQVTINNDGTRVEITSGSKDFLTRTEVYGKDGKLLSRDLLGQDGLLIHEDLTTGQRAETKFTGKVEIQNDGSVKLYTAPTFAGAKDGDYKVYRRVGNDWKLVFYKHQIRPAPNAGAHISWMEESWSEDGSKYTKDVWGVKEHAQLQENDAYHISKTLMEGGKATTTFYHTGRMAYMWGSVQQGASDAQVTYVHSLDANGKLGEMLSFQLIPDGRFDWRNSWTKEGGWDTNSGGWPYGQGGRGLPAGPGVRFQDFEIGSPVELDPRGAETLRLLPFVTVQVQWKDGNRVETISSGTSSDALHNEYVRFVYDGANKLISQAHVKETYDKQGGNLISRETTRQAADGRMVTFTGKWEQGRWIERAGDYLQYKCLTVDYGTDPNGLSRRCYGELKNGTWAEESFDASGQMKERSIYEKQDGKRFEHWTLEGSTLKVNHSNFDPSISGVYREYQMDEHGQWQLTKYEWTGTGRGSWSRYWKEGGNWKWRDDSFTPREQAMTVGSPKVTDTISADPNATWNKQSGRMGEATINLPLAGAS